jgi:GNAT superfamily N-acetyltransferase
MVHKEPNEEPNEEIYTATTESDYAAFAELVTEYVGWCRERYQADSWFVDQVFGHQALEDELKQLAVSYGPPRGKTLLVRSEGQVCGGGAYRRLDDGSFELKRLFVPLRFQGRGLGRRLSLALLKAAQDEGCHCLRLDTGNLLTEAIALYKSLGFRECPPYHNYPERFLPYLIFMELSLP